MALIEILVLSFIQGITEFLPVSSSGHLIVVPFLFGWADQGLEIDVAVHMGTLAAVLVYFWQDLWLIIRDFIRYCISGFNINKYSANVRFGFILIGATIPAVIVGFSLKRLGIDMVRKIEIIIATTAIFAVLMYIADRFSQKIQGVDKVTWGAGLLIGIAQAFALIPGTSRSGACMTAARFLQLDRSTAARFAFLLGIPSIAGAGLLTALDVVKAGQPLFTSQIGYAMVFSMLFGMLAIKFMLSFVSRHSLTPFVIYRLVLAAVLLVFYI